MSNAIRVFDVDKGFKKMQSTTRKLERESPNRVNIGLFGKQDSDIVKIGTENEFGTSIIPERSFLRSAMDENKKEIGNIVERKKIDIIMGKIKVETFLKQMGIFGKKLIQKKIVDGPFEPNAPSTLKAKFPKTKPLINTGRLRGSITTEIP